MVVATAGIGVWAMAPIGSAEVTVDEPLPAQLAAFADTSILFGHQSVGANIIDGIGAVYASAGEPAPRVAEIGTGEDAPDGAGIAHAFVGINGDPFGKLRDFEALVDDPASAGAEVALVKFCYLDITSSSDVRAVFDAYTATMDALEARHPDITFLYTTVPLTTDRSWKAKLKALVGAGDQLGPADNVARREYNTLIRERYAESGRLFDIAAVETTADDGPLSRMHDGAEYFVLNAALSSDAGHLNELGGKAAASALIRTVTAAHG